LCAWFSCTVAEDSVEVLKKIRNVAKRSLTDIEKVLLGADLKPHDVMIKQNYLLFGNFILLSKNAMDIPYYPTDNAHLTYNAHPKLFYIPFEVQITHT
jgi:hypothetical protein